MKRVLGSILTLGIVGALVFTASRAYFSDSEQSTGNVFQAGELNLKIDSECHYFQNGQEVGCYYGEDETPFGTWDSTDLTNEKFFMFQDVKPGDWGENTISLTVEDNDAYACMYIENAQNLENDRVDPEVEAGDTTDDPDGGELAQNLHFTAWIDQGTTPGWQGKGQDGGEGDNIWQGELDEPLLFSNVEGPASDVLDGKVYDLNVFGPLAGGVTHYLGVQWCAGDMTVSGSTISCDGSTMGNEAQTDSLTADVRFYVEQARNNQGFICPALPLPEAEVVEANNWSLVDTDVNGDGVNGKWEWLAKAKVNEPNPASDFELQVGISDTDSNFFDQDDTVWTDNQQEAFTLTYDGLGQATLEVANRPTTTFTVGASIYNRLGITLRAPADATTSVDNLSLDIASLPVSSKSVTNGTNSLTILGVDLSDGFVLTGNFTFDWGVLTSNGENQKVQFSID